MAKTIGLLLAVVAIWITVEVYTQGVDGAFGGRLASLAGDSGEPPRGSTVQRAGAAVERAGDLRDARYGELIPD